MGQFAKQVPTLTHGATVAILNLRPGAPAWPERSRRVRPRSSLLRHEAEGFGPITSPLYAESQSLGQAEIAESDLDSWATRIPLLLPWLTRGASDDAKRQLGQKPIEL